MKKYLWMLSAAVMIGALRVNYSYSVVLIHGVFTVGKAPQTKQKMQRNKYRLYYRYFISNVSSQDSYHIYYKFQTVDSQQYR